MNTNANVENVGSRYLFDKNETSLTLEDNLITTLEWNIQEKGHMNALEYIGGNYIKLTKIPKGIKVYWNTQNNRAGAMLLDDVNRGVKVSKQNKFGQLMTYRNYFLWSEGEIGPDESNPNIILEFTGKGVEVEYLLGSATEVQLLADQFNKLNQNLENMVESLSNLEISAEANANQLVLTLPQNFTWTVAINTTQINKIPVAYRPTIKITNHVDHYHINLAWSATPFASSTIVAAYTAIALNILTPLIGQLIIKSSLPISYTIKGIIQIGFKNFPSDVVLYDELFTKPQVRGLQSINQTSVDYNAYGVAQGTNDGSGLIYTNNTSGFIVQGGQVDKLRITGGNINNYTGIAIGTSITNASNHYANILAWLLKYYPSYVTDCPLQIDFIAELDQIWNHN